MEDDSPGSSMSTSSSLAPGDRIMSVKTSINRIRWNEVYRRRLEDFVDTVNATTTHAYSFSKFIFLREFERERAEHIARDAQIAQNLALGIDEDVEAVRPFDIESYINTQFFSEVWLSLTMYHRGRGGKLRSLLTDGMMFINS
jgi:hypothetical protein